MSTATRTALVQIYSEMHGLIVGVGKHYCKTSKPVCENCPLQPFLPESAFPNRSQISGHDSSK
jgi:endonuclease III-like uncharacterized protein